MYKGFTGTAPQKGSVQKNTVEDNTWSGTKYARQDGPKWLKTIVVNI